MTSRLLLATVMVALVAGIYFYAGRSANRSAGTPTTSLAADWQSYRSGRSGVTFRYPLTYFLTERDMSTPSRRRHAIVLMEDTHEHRDLVAGRSAAPREDPPTITLDLFQADGDDDTAERWVRGAGDSNYRLSRDGELRHVTLGGVPALAYRWDGLYAGESRVLVRPDWIHMWSLTYLDPQDQIVRDFDAILDTVKFE